METLPQTLKISDTGNSGTIEFVRKRRNDVPVVIEIDPFTDHTRFLRSQINHYAKYKVNRRFVA